MLGYTPHPTTCYYFSGNILWRFKVLLQKWYSLEKIPLHKFPLAPLQNLLELTWKMIVIIAKTDEIVIVEVYSYSSTFW